MDAVKTIRDHCQTIHFYSINRIMYHGGKLSVK